jgi:hypothetical protein
MFGKVGFMAALETNQVLIAILEMLKQQAQYSYLLHGWVIAVSETIEKSPELKPLLKAHPTYDQGPQPALQGTQHVIGNIDALIRQLRG